MGELIEFETLSHANEAAPFGASSQRLRAIGLSDFLAMEFPPRPMLLAPWLPMGGLAMLFAPRGVRRPPRPLRRRSAEPLRRRARRRQAHHRRQHLDPVPVGPGQRRRILDAGAGVGARPPARGTGGRFRASRGQGRHAAGHLPQRGRARHRHRPATARGLQAVRGRALRGPLSRRRAGSPARRPSPSRRRLRNTAGTRATSKTCSMVASGRCTSRALSSATSPRRSGNHPRP